MSNRTAIVASLLVSLVATEAVAQAWASEREVFALENQVQAGDASAMRKLLAMHTDGAVAEYVDIILGSSIKKHPKTFLEVVATEPKAQCSSCLDGKLANLGDDFVDKYRKQIDELVKRRKALQSVDVASLRATRDRCIAILNSQILQVEGALERESVERP